MDARREGTRPEEPAGSYRGETAGWTAGTRIGLDSLPTCYKEHLLANRLPFFLTTGGALNATNFSGFRGGSLGISVGFFIEPKKSS